MEIKLFANNPFGDFLRAIEMEGDTKECGCNERRDYDGERITTHCKEHCPKVQSGKQDRCGGC